MKARKVEAPVQEERIEGAYPKRARPHKADAAKQAPDLQRVSSYGIPDKELTPRVRNALTMLLQEVERLREELEKTTRRADELARTADQDTLLPILNRRAFIREITRSIALAERYGTPSSMLYFDLDNFKAVNDAYGHPAGDAVLRHFSDLISSQIRDSDVLARLGGDEFGVILNHVTLEQATRKGEMLALTLRERPPVWNDEAVFLSFAFGAYELRAGETADAAIQHADHAMYTQKMQGRDPIKP